MAIRLVPTGRLIKEYMSANKVRQIDLARHSNFSEKQISLILTGKASLAEKVADSLSELIPGTSKEYWMNYDAKYWKQVKEEKREIKNTDYETINKRFSLSKLFGTQSYSKLRQLELIQEATGSKDIVSHYDSPNNGMLRPVFLKDNEKVSSDFINIWIDLVLYFRYLAGEEEFAFKGIPALRELMESDLKRALYVTDSLSLERNLKHFCKAAGINLIFMKNVPTSYVRGMTFAKSGKIYIVLTDRFKSVEFTIFAFVHELEHILNGDITVEGNLVEILGQNIDCEERASQNALDFLLGGDLDEICKSVSSSNNISKTLFYWSNKEKVTPGVIVTILQHNQVIDYSSQRQFLNSYTCTPDFEF